MVRILGYSWMGIYADDFEADTVFVDAIDRVAPGCEANGLDALRGGVLAIFEMSGERFQVWVVNPQTI